MLEGQILQIYRSCDFEYADNSALRQVNMRYKYLVFGSFVNDRFNHL